MKTISIGELADLSGIGKETIRYYEREALLPPPRRTASNYRRYTPDTKVPIHPPGQGAGLPDH